MQSSIPIAPIAPTHRTVVPVAPAGPVAIFQIQVVDRDTPRAPVDETALQRLSAVNSVEELADYVGSLFSPRGTARQPGAPGPSPDRESDRSRNAAGRAEGFSGGPLRLEETQGD